MEKKWKYSGMKVKEILKMEKKVRNTEKETKGIWLFYWWQLNTSIQLEKYGIIFCVLTK